MIRWYDAAYVYVGYAAPVNGVMHYFTETAGGVITDVGTTKPVAFVTTHCAPADTAVKVRTAGRQLLNTFTNFNYGVTNTNLFTSTFTNTFTVPILYTITFNTERAMVVPIGIQYNASYQQLVSNIPAIGFLFNNTTMYHRADHDSNNTVVRTLNKHDVGSEATYLLAVGQSVTFTGGYVVAANTVPTVAANALTFVASYKIVEA